MEANVLENMEVDMDMQVNGNEDVDDEDDDLEDIEVDDDEGNLVNLDDVDEDLQAVLAEQSRNPVASITFQSPEYDSGITSQVNNLIGSIVTDIHVSPQDFEHGNNNEPDEATATQTNVNIEEAANPAVILPAGRVRSSANAPRAPVIRVRRIPRMP
jgi:hypothetical protein